MEWQRTCLRGAFASFSASEPNRGRDPVVALFQRCTAGSGGFLYADDFVAMARQALGLSTQDISDGALRTCFNAMDREKAGRVGYDRLASWLDLKRSFSSSECAELEAKEAAASAAASAFVNRRDGERRRPRSQGTPRSRGGESQRGSSPDLHAGATGGGAAAAVRLCPAGHTLLFSVLEEEHFCRGCSLPIQVGEPVLDCRICNWSLCSTCESGEVGLREFSDGAEDGDLEQLGGQAQLCQSLSIPSMAAGSYGANPPQNQLLQRQAPPIGAAARFKQELLRRAPNLAKVWREVLDPSQQGYVTRAEFVDACRRLHFRGNIRDAWQELDIDRSGKLCLKELDWDTAEALGRLQATLSAAFGGSLEGATAGLGLVGGARLRRREFVELLTSKSLAVHEEAEIFFQLLCSDATAASHAVSCREVEWLWRLRAHLPRATAGRVRPGRVAVGLLGRSRSLDALEEESCEEALQHSLSSIALGYESEGPPVRSTRSRHIRLYAMAKELEIKRANAVAEAGALAQAEAARSRPQAAAFNQAALDRLHRGWEELQKRRAQLAKQLHLAECPAAARKAQSNPEARQRLLTPKRQPRPLAAPAPAPPPGVACMDPPTNDEGAAVTRSDKNGYRGLFYCKRALGEDAIPGSLGRCGPTGGPQCASCKRFQVLFGPREHPGARLFKDHYTRVRAAAQRQNEKVENARRDAQKMCQAKKAEAKDIEEISQRMHTEAKRHYAKIEKRRDAKKGEEADEMKSFFSPSLLGRQPSRDNALRDKAALHEEAVARLFGDASRRTKDKEEKRCQKELREQEHTEAMSVHRNQTSDGTVFDRLHANYKMVDKREMEPTWRVPHCEFGPVLQLAATPCHATASSGVRTASMTSSLPRHSRPSTPGGRASCRGTATRSTTATGSAPPSRPLTARQTPPGSRARKKTHNLFDILDKNGDGAISAAEFANAQRAGLVAVAPALALDSAKGIVAAAKARRDKNAAQSFAHHIKGGQTPRQGSLSGFSRNGSICSLSTQGGRRGPPSNTHVHPEPEEEAMPFSPPPRRAMGSAVSAHR